MPVSPLSENPSLENLKKQAKSLVKEVRARDPEAFARVREFHPRAEDVLQEFSLSAAQLVTARSYGFASWSRLKRHIEIASEYTWSPPASEAGTLEEKLIRLACLDYEGYPRGRAEKARRLLAEHPELASASIYAAATAGDEPAARSMIAANRTLVNAKGGPLAWEPLLYACYSRLESEDASTLKVARVLLEAGADPNAGFLWHGNVPPFTALTGVFGEGESGEPPHRDRGALTRMLLDAGADPNDGQTLYNCHFKPADDHLEILFAYGLGRDKGGPWYERLGDRLQSPSRLLVEELWSAARKNYFDRVRLLVEHGADVNTPGVRDGRTPYEAAVRAGNHEIASYLVQHGATKTDIGLKERFAAACIAGQRAEALAILEANPNLIETLGHHGRVELVHRAVESRRQEGVRLMAEVGFEMSDMTDHDSVGLNLAATPLHNAAWIGDLAMVKLLIELGADPSVRDPNHHGTPLGWAAFNHQQHVVDFLLPTAGIFDALHNDGVERVTELLENDPQLANARDRSGNPLAFYLHAEMTRMDEIVAVLQRHGGDINARDGKGRTVLDIVDPAEDSDFANALQRAGAVNGVVAR